MLLSELRKLVRDTGSPELKSSYRPLQQECDSNLAQMSYKLSLGAKETRSRQVVQWDGGLPSPNPKGTGWMKRNEMHAQAPIHVSQSPRYVQKLSRRGRRMHQPEVTILSELNRDIQDVDLPREGRRAVGRTRLRNHVKDRVYSSAADSRHSMTTARMLHQFRQAVADRDVVKVFETKAAEQKSQRLSRRGERRDSVVDGSAIGSQLSVVSRVQGSQVSEVSGVTGTDVSRGSQSEASTSADSASKSTLASSVQTSLNTQQSSFWDSTIAPTNASSSSVSTKSSLPSTVATGTGFSAAKSDKYKPPPSIDM